MSTRSGTGKAKTPPADARVSARIARGIEMLRRMGREATVDDQKALDPALYELTVGHLFGDIWTRPGLSLRDRQLVTLAANLALVRPGHANESHFRSALHVGVTKEEIVEVLIQVGHYAGWPALATGVDQFGRVLAQAAAKRETKGATKRAAKGLAKTATPPAPAVAPRPSRSPRPPRAPAAGGTTAPTARRTAPATAATARRTAR